MPFSVWGIDVREYYRLCLKNCLKIYIKRDPYYDSYDFEWHCIAEYFTHE